MTDSMASSASIAATTAPVAPAKKRQPSAKPTQPAPAAGDAVPAAHWRQKTTSTTAPVQQQQKQKQPEPQPAATGGGGGEKQKAAKKKAPVAEAPARVPAVPLKKHRQPAVQKAKEQETKKKRQVSVETSTLRYLRRQGRLDTETGRKMVVLHCRFDRMVRNALKENRGEYGTLLIPPNAVAAIQAATEKELRSLTLAAALEMEHTGKVTLTAKTLNHVKRQQGVFEGEGVHTLQWIRDYGTTTKKRRRHRSSSKKE